MPTDAVLVFVMPLTPKADHTPWSFCVNLIRRALVPLPLHFLKEFAMALSSDLFWGLSFEILL